MRQRGHPKRHGGGPCRRPAEATQREEGARITKARRGVRRDAHIQRNDAWSKEEKEKEKEEKEKNKKKKEKKTEQGGG